MNYLAADLLISKGLDTMNKGQFKFAVVKRGYREIGMISQNRLLEVSKMSNRSFEEEEFKEDPQLTKI